MNRFKFRAWHIRNEKMYEVIALDFRGTVTVKDGDYIMVTAQDNVILQQCTGVKDKKMVEVFEGDLVSVYRGVEGVIVFLDGAFCLQQLNVSYYNPIAEYGQLEVIGNIHESEVINE
jgi:uncharacterized phage protein (TIGR01671 family)